MLKYFSDSLRKSTTQPPKSQDNKNEKQTKNEIKQHGELELSQSLFQSLNDEQSNGSNFSSQPEILQQPQQRKTQEQNNEQKESQKHEEKFEHITEEAPTNINRNNSSDDEIDVGISLDIDDQLTQSIRQQDLKKKDHKNMHTEQIKKDDNPSIKMPKSKICYSIQENLQKNNSLLQKNRSSHVSFSDLNENNNYESFSDFNTQGSELRVHRDFSKVKQKQQPKVYQKLEQQEQDINFWGTPQEVKQSTLNIESIRQTKKKQEKKQDNNSQQLEQNQQIGIDLDKSMFTQRIKPIQNRSPTKFNKNSPVKGQFVSKKSQQEQQIKAMQQSHYMQPIPDYNSNKQLKKSKQNQGKTIQKENQIKVVQMGKIYFLKFKNKEEVISQKFFQILTELFLKDNIMLPLFNIKLLQKWKEQNDSNNQIIDASSTQQGLQENAKTFDLYIKRYFQFLTRKYFQQVKKIFVDVKKTKASFSKPEQSTTVKKQQAYPFGNVFKKFTQYFQKLPYSKAQILKKSLQAKLLCMNEIQQNWIQSFPQYYEGQEKNEFPLTQSKSNNYLKGIKNNKFALEKEIANLQILINFQKSQVYCQKKLQQKLEENIWKERKKKLIQDRNWFITNMFDLCYF